MLALASSRSRALRCSSAVFFVGALLWAGCSGGSGGGSSGSGANAGPHADFTATPTSGPRPLAVQFTDTTSGAATDWEWDFGDGTGSTARHPLHVYTHPGSFSVKLSATGPGGIATKLRPAFIGATAPLLDAGLESQTAGAAPSTPWEPFFGTQGSFGQVMNSLAGGADGGMPTEGQLWVELGGDSTNDVLPPNAGAGPTPRTGAGLAQEFTFPVGQSVLHFDVVFVNGEALNSPLTNDWMSADVSDGSTTLNLLRRDTFSPVSGHSTLHGGNRTTAVETVTANLQALFPDSNYLTPFTLTVQVGNAGNGSLPSQAYLDNLRFEVPQPPLDAQFDAIPTQVALGQPVGFVDLTLGATAWVWDFGDGRGSNARNPVHTYAQSGVYDVKLHVSAPGTQGELLRPDLIEVLAPTGTVQFDGQPRPVAVNAPVSFTNLSNGNFNGTWLWEFGDGQTSSASGFGPRVLHSYSTVGAKSVRLTGTLIDGTPLSLFKPGYIDVQTPVSISSHPASVTVNEGQVANFSVVANGTQPLIFEWRKNGLAVGAPSSPNFATPPTTPADDGAKFRVLVSNAVSSLLSNEATLSVIVKPVIQTHPAPVAVPPGGQAVFNVALVPGSGTPPLTFKWRKNGADIAGAPNLPSFTLTNVQQVNNGEFYSVRIFNSAGQVISNDALLT
ncbi:MAG TPA: PKD domain-containing protein, partial [Planctomycetota bacterium]|nr:PKD domain-containing protein [Planctomycetota bacterium]